MSADAPSFDAYFSDPHFGHRNILKYEDRPFDDVDHMNEELIETYNQLVGMDDFVLWLGDSFMGGVDGAAILDKLNGRKGLLLGNHDKRPHQMAAMGFTFVTRELRTHIAGKSVLMHHYPYWPYGNRTVFKDRHGRDVDFSKEPGRLEKMKAKYAPRKKGDDVLIHGHTHGKKKLHDNNQIHVGVDAWDYGPVLHEWVEELVAQV